MKSPTTAAYPITFVALVGVVVVGSAIALSLLYSHQPAFLVRVFGDAVVVESGVAWSRIRPDSTSAPARGRFDAAQLLPLSLPLPPTTYRAPRGDPVYESVAAGARKLLDRARIAAQQGEQSLSLEAYRSLVGLFPENRALLIEQASVLASFGQHPEAAAVLLSPLSRFSNDVALHFLAAQNLWWAGNAIAADSLLGLTLALEPGHGSALQLRQTLRQSSAPDLATALRWVSERNQPLENLLVARAYVREQQYAAAIPYYRAATARTDVADSLLLEVASAAVAADSIALLDEITQRQIARGPHNLEAPLRLARAYAWRRDYVQAIRLYDRVLASNADPTIRLEKAVVLIWAGREPEARVELEAVTAAQPHLPEPHKLLGDLAFYRGDWSVARRHYDDAARWNPLYPGLAEASARAAEKESAARLAALPGPEPESYTTRLDSYGDNQRFRWLSIEGMRAVRAGNSMLKVAAQHHVAQAEPTGALSRNPGFGFSVGGEFRPKPQLLLAAGAGLDRFADVATFAKWSMGVTIYDFLGVTTALEYAHEPALRRAVSLVSLQARTVADALRLTASAARGDWSIWTEAEAQRFTSRFGDTHRLDAGVSVSRVLSGGLDARATLNAVTSAGAAPMLPGWGALYWSPEYYIEPSIGAQYAASLSPALALTSRLSLGAAFMRERNHDRRFDRSVVPVGSAGLDLRYTAGAWAVNAGVTFGGAMTGGYRAGTLRIQATYRLPR